MSLTVIVKLTLTVDLTFNTCCAVCKLVQVLFLTDIYCK